MKYPTRQLAVLLLVASFLSGLPLSTYAQDGEQGTPAEDNEPAFTAVANLPRKALTDKSITFDASESVIPEGASVQEVLWDFGDGVRTTGEKVTHTYTRPGTYSVRLTVTADGETREEITELTVYDHVIVLLADTSVSAEQIELRSRQAAEEGILLLALTARGGGPEALVEEELTQALVAARAEVARANIIVSWAAGGIGPNVLSRFAQTVRQTDELSLSSLDFDSKGIIMLSETSFRVLSPTAQSTYDQLQPAYVLLTRPDALPLLFTATTSDEARTAIIESPIDYRLLGSFSSRAITDLGFTNFMSFGINYLINGGVPINNIVLILMIPVIATILSFARQVIGIKAFGLITPAMTTLSFLVMGLFAGLIVFVVVVLSGTLTRLLLKRLHLLYLPRMALVLTTASLAILIMFGVGAALNNTASLSFSIFPILILTILAEEFIAVQFSRGARVALRITTWTLILAIVCYFIVSWQPLRLLLLSYPELVLLAIPINIILGRFTGLRLVEYIRFRELLRYTTKSEAKQSVES